MKKIVNIVFYQFFGTADNTKKACIFYDDGTVANVGFEEGIDACEIIVKERNIRSKDAFREMINKDLVHVVSGAEFEKNYRKYFPMSNEISTNVVKENKVEEDIIDEDIEDVDLEEDSKEVNTIVTPVVAEEEEKDDKDVDINNNVVVVNDAEGNELDEEIEHEEKPGFFKRTWQKIKNSKIIKRIAVCATAIAIGLGLYSCSQRRSLEGTMARSNIFSFNRNKTNDEDLTRELNLIDSNDNVLAEGLTEIDYNGKKLIKGSNDYYDDYTFDELLAVTDSQIQKETMANLDEALWKFNGEFAEAYLEEGKDVRAALTFDEVIALQIAYNDYSKEELKAIFNGADLRANKLSRAYKDATLQLMGAHVIETREHPVDMSMLLREEEGKEFYKRYHEAFLAAKEATGEDQLAKVAEFYRMVRADFEVNPQVRSTGISHAEVYDIEPYKLSVTPMISAAEIMFQNLRVDVTLNDLEVEFFNNLGLCNMADAAFSRAEAVSLGTCKEDDTNPLYEQYRNAIIKKYKDLGIYYIDDKHRELTLLDRFQKIVNGQHKDLRVGGYKYNKWVRGGGGSSTTTKIETHTETETTYREEVTREEKEIPEEIRKQIDDEIAIENEEVRVEAEQKAEEVRQEMQEIEDQHAEEIFEEIRQDEADLQHDIEVANEQIDQNISDQNPANDVPVNESDFGDHNVDFFDDYSDSEGNLDSSVMNITTDPTGDKTNEPLPDPNVTGAIFDAAAPESYESFYTEEVTYVENQPTTDYTVEDTYVAPTVDSSTDTSSYVSPSEDSSFWVDVTPDYITGSYEPESTWTESSSDYSFVDSNPVTSFDGGSDYSAPAAEPSYSEPAVTYSEPVVTYSEPTVEYFSSEDTGSGWVESVQVSDDTSYEDFWVEESSGAKSSYSYEELVDAYVESMANTNTEDEEYSFQFIK